MATFRPSSHTQLLTLRLPRGHRQAQGSWCWPLLSPALQGSAGRPLRSLLSSWEGASNRLPRPPLPLCCCSRRLAGASVRERLPWPGFLTCPISPSVHGWKPPLFCVDIRQCWAGGGGRTPAGLTVAEPRLVLGTSGSSTLLQRDIPGEPAVSRGSPEVLMGLLGGAAPVAWELAGPPGLSNEADAVGGGRGSLADGSSWH